MTDFNKMSSVPTCRACGHFEWDHVYTDGQGCRETIDYDRETNAYERCHCFEFIPGEVKTITLRPMPPSRSGIYVVKDINNIAEVRSYIRANEQFLTDEQAYEIQTAMGMLIEPPNSTKPDPDAFINQLRLKGMIKVSELDVSYCLQCKHPGDVHKDGPCNYCDCDYHVKCECGHHVGAHFDGNYEYQACLYENCECVKFYLPRKG